MAELADALDSGSNDRKVVEVQVLLPAPMIGKYRQMLADHYLFTIHFSLVLYLPIIGK